MTLTPEDVRNKRFTPVRLREGYDMGEVDQFLDEVEAELERLSDEAVEPRSRVGSAVPGEPAGRSVPQPESPEPEVAAEQPEPRPEPEPEPVPRSVGEASSAATRLLEIATRNADEVVTDAKEQADRILAEAQATSEQLEQDSRDRADRVGSDAAARAERLDSEISTRREQMLGELESDRDSLADEVEHLRAFEREYRSRLRSYFSAQLAQLEGEQATADPLPDGDSDHRPQRLRSLLGEDHEQS